MNPNSAQLIHAMLVPAIMIIGVVFSVVEIFKGYRIVHIEITEMTHEKPKKVLQD